MFTFPRVFDLGFESVVAVKILSRNSVLDQSSNKKAKFAIPTRRLRLNKGRKLTKRSISCFDHSFTYSSCLGTASNLIIPFLSRGGASGLKEHEQQIGAVLLACSE